MAEIAVLRTCRPARRAGFITSSSGRLTKQVLTLYFHLVLDMRIFSFESYFILYKFILNIGPTLSLLMTLCSKGMLTKCGIQMKPTTEPSPGRYPVVRANAGTHNRLTCIRTSNCEINRTTAAIRTKRTRRSGAIQRMSTRRPSTASLSRNLKVQYRPL